MTRTTFARLLRGALIAPVVIAAACSDDPVRVDEHDHAAVEGVRLWTTLPDGSEGSYVMEPAPTPREVMVAEGENTLRVEWLDHDGEVVGGLDEEYRLELRELPDGMSFVRTSPFEGTLTVDAGAGTATTRLELFHIEEGHDDLTVTVSFVTPAEL